jgi:two-component system uhpT operon response regulator UhpA
MAHMVGTGSAHASTSAAAPDVDRLRVVIVDDHPLFRLALREVLARYLEFEVVAEAASVAEAIACFACHAFDVAIVDLVLPDGRGSELVDHVLDVQPDCRVLALSGVEEPTQMAEILRAGASGFAMKSQSPSEIVDALRCVVGGCRSIPAVSRDQIDRLLDSPDGWPLERLTPREREVFDLLVGGYTNEGIAARLVISRRTVETHRLRVMNKLLAHSLGDLLQIATRHGLVGGQRR